MTCWLAARLPLWYLALIGLSVVVAGALMVHAMVKHRHEGFMKLVGEGFKYGLGVLFIAGGIIWVANAAKSEFPGGTFSQVQVSVPSNVGC